MQGKARALHFADKDVEAASQDATRIGGFNANKRNLFLLHQRICCRGLRGEPNQEWVQKEFDKFMENWLLNLMMQM